MQIRPDQIDPEAVKVVQRLRRFDHAAYVVGGCVRDLLLGRKPKDFDIATSATPPEIRRLFRNCRIIGRRFRLAHIFFGAKIIETATFRANPREGEEEAVEGTAAPEALESSELLIRRDNVFGTAEEDARRRDFTINGLFYDIETGQVIDYVEGMPDLEARVVRTIGDPDIRFREDPIRILRAVKFAARCELTIEPETYRRMLEHASEIAKCAQARVSEEVFRLLRGGAAKRSMELLVETGLLKTLLPELAAALESHDPAAELKKRRLWAYLAALDRSTARRETPPSNALVLATLLLPPLRDPLHPDSTAVRDVGQLVTLSIQPVLERLKASRKDGELTRQVLLALRYIFPSSNPNRRRPRLAGRAFLDDALRLHEILSDAEALDPSLAGAALVADGEATPPAETDDAIARELESAEPAERPRRPPPEARVPAGARVLTPTHTSTRRPDGPGGPTVRTPIPDLRGLTVTTPRPAFLGTGCFGRWGSFAD